MFEITFILVLILANGFFAASEMAFVTARTSKLRSLSEQGNRKATRVLEAREESVNFLAMIQIGTTLVATLASAVGGASTARLLTPVIEPFFGRFAGNVALTLIVIIITYATLVIGELVPKQFAIQHAERLAMSLINTLIFLQKLFWLPIKLINLSTKSIMRLIGDSKESLEYESTEEIAMIVQQAASDGVIDPQEESLINRIFDYSEASVADIMTPRPNLIFLYAAQTVAEGRALSEESGFSRFVIADGELDEFIGYLHVKDLLTAEGNRPIQEFAREATVVPETLKLPTAFNILVRSESHLAIVVDEFGSVAGLVTLEDMLEEIVGEIEDEYSTGQPSIEAQDKQSWMVEGSTSLLDVKNNLGIEFPDNGDFNTLAGFIVHRLGTIPKVGDAFQYKNVILTVEELDGYRISQVKIFKKSTNPVR